MSSSIAPRPGVGRDLERGLFHFVSAICPSLPPGREAGARELPDSAPGERLAQRGAKDARAPTEGAHQPGQLCAFGGAVFVQAALDRLDLVVGL
jgi:hypothetical protein